MKKLLSLLLGACTIFTACTNEDDGIFLPDNQLQLKFGVNNPTSRAIFTESTLPNDNPVGVKLDDGDEIAYDKYTNITFTGSTNDKGVQVWTPSEAVVLGPTKAILYAYYPWISGVSIDAIPVDMTAEDQTDWLYATPVENVDEDNASHAVTMNHALANINLTINRGSYVGDGNISSITVQSDAFATKGTFNAAQPEPAFTSFADTEGQPLTRSITATLGSTTDIMVVPTATEANIDFVINVDGVNYTAQAKPVQLVNGNSYLYTLTLNSTFLGVSAFSVQPWVTQEKENDLVLEKEETKLTWETATDGVYAVSSKGEPMLAENADESCVAVALVNGEHKFWIAKTDASDGDGNYYLIWELMCTDLSLTNYDVVDGTNRYGFLPKPDGTYHSTPNLSNDFITWTAGALSDFNGKANTAVIAAASSEAEEMCTVLNTFNASDSYSDWYVPACGQLALMYLNKTEINAALTKIGGTAFATEDYYSSSENGYDYGCNVGFDDGGISTEFSKIYGSRVRFIRDIVVEEEPEKPTTPTINSAGKPNGVYVVTAAGELVDKTTVAADAIGVALITDNQRIFIEKMGEANTDIIKAAYDADGATNTDYTYFYWGMDGSDVADIDNKSSADAAMQDFNGKANTATIIATPDTDSYTKYANMGTYCTKFNEMSGTFADWYIPAAGQLYEIYTNITDINTALTNIGGTNFNKSGAYWSSSEHVSYYGWLLILSGGDINYSDKDGGSRVRFVRDLQ